MELNLSEIERLLSVSRYQISRYATDGRLQRVRQGHYEAASLANLAPAFDKWDYCGRYWDEERALFLVRAGYAFRRELHSVIEARYRAAGKWGRVDLTPDQQQEIEQAVKGYVSILAARPND